MGRHDGRLQVWGGVECTVNRVGDRHFDQLEYSGHGRRIDDLDLFANLGLTTIRYPVLWERVERPDGDLDFSWTDERLARLREIGLSPIVGLLHHGSGPSHTSLVDPAFPGKFARYARSVAERYPWVERFTPINEPLTTARFSGLYGHWYPHGRNDRTFVRALLNQCKAVCLAMREIRRVNPGARLVQTEDMGFTRSTQALHDQATFENERRWLSLDLLAGRVCSGHPLFGYLLQSGASAQDLAFFCEEGVAADLIGINYYITSERFLDARVELYPSWVIGGNSRQPYADVEAVRVCTAGLLGPTPLLAQACERYQSPVAITEAHLGSSVDQQMSWLAYVWASAMAARRRGADVRAVTVWALLGAFGWDRLVTEAPGNYESGVFDLSGDNPQETALAGFVRALGRGEEPSACTGWWAQDDRLLYPPHDAASSEAV